MDSLYQQLVSAGCQTNNHESDLYVRRTPEAEQIIAKFEAEGGITNKSGFISQIDKQPWIELPFAYEPFWIARQR